MSNKFLDYEIEPLVHGSILRSPDLHDGSLLRLSLEEKKIVLELRSAEHLVEIHALNVLTAEFVGMPHQMIVGQIQIWRDAPKDVFKHEVMTSSIHDEFVNDPIHDYDDLIAKRKTVSVLKVTGIVGIQLTIASETIKFFELACGPTKTTSDIAEMRQGDILAFIKDFRDKNPELANLDKDTLASKVASEFKKWPKKS